MAKENATQTTEKRSNTPLLIIGAVLVIALLGGWWFYSSSKSNPTSSPANNSNSSTIKQPKASQIPPNAPPGAQPANEKGSPTATVTLEEFADFQCPQCAQKNPIMNEIKSIYGSRIRFIFRELPLDIKAHDKSYDAAIAAEAAGLQGKFWEMQNMLFSNQKAWTEDADFKQIWKGYAQKIGLDVAKWETDQIGFVARQRVEDDKKRAKAIGINGTPSLYLNGNSVQLDDMTVDTLKSMIDAELAKGSQQQQQQANQVPAANKSSKGVPGNATAID
jgi:protein-disulfide isomerase